MTLKSTSRVKLDHKVFSSRGSFTLALIVLLGFGALLVASWWLPVSEIENENLAPNITESSDLSISTTTKNLIALLPAPIKDVLVVTHNQLENVFRITKPITTTAIIADTNLARRNAGVLNDLKENKDLNTIAQKRLEDMFAKQYFEHLSPEGIGASDVAIEIGYRYLNIAENLAVGDFAHSQEMVLDWMNSPGHRANIVNEKFSEIGVAVKKGRFKGQDVWIGVQIFARPESECQAPDQSQKATIDQESNILDQKQSLADSLLVEIKAYEQRLNLSQAEYADYQQKITQYNQLASNLNQRSQELQLLISDYNTDVRTYNICIQ